MADAKRGDTARRLASWRRPKGMKLSDMVADGLYVASAATRLQLKNRILVDVIARGGDFDVQRLMPEARETLLTLAAEAEQDAQRIESARLRAKRRHSDSYGTHDYRSRDVRNLRKRQRQSEQVAAELRARAEDENELRTLVEDAREAAWSEVERNIDSTLRIEAARPDLEPDYGKLRDARMQSLRLIDLPRLAAHRRRNAQGAAGTLNDEKAMDAPAEKVGDVDLSELE
ncbi:asparagine synthase [Microbacterium horticulturae]|uniref:Asparagine synthase n=1 Tax=Microbacterium horticulturae TaxID=3028316 RepID=A0ABY8C2U7_9MICO|nr:asparagine synthase [Microbacterium sp. KACC 23027]WEG09555.1 asparagine synthase [Microbacterium sp. KACC 23027]